MDWSLLPKDLLELIAKFLESHFDFLRFRRVCTSWRASAPLNLRTPPILCSHVHVHTDEVENKFFLWKGTFLLLEFPAVLIRNNPKFWLVRLDVGELGKQRFANPLYWRYLESVEFPLLLDTSKVHVQELGHQYIKVVNMVGFDVRFTFLGKDNDVITYEQNDSGILFFRKFGGEELSTIEVEGFSRCVDFVQLKHKCYATDCLGNTICVDPFSGSSFLMADEFAAALAAEEESKVGGIYVLGHRYKYLVELCGNLLSVEVEWTDENVTLAFRCEVFQLDEERKSWDPVVSLGNAILFVGMYCKFSIPAIPGVEGNCIVFNFWEGFMQDETSDFGKASVFHLSSGMIVPLYHRPDLFELFRPPSFLMKKGGEVS